MPEPDYPVIELIAQNIIDTLKDVTEDNDYYQTLNPRRPTRDIFEANGPLSDLDVLVVQDDPVLIEDNPYGVQEWEQPFLLSICLQDSDSSTTAIDTRKNYAVSDVITAIMEDTSRGGYAIDTVIKDVYSFPVELSETGITVVINVKYRTQYDDPYSTP